MSVSVSMSMLTSLGTTYKAESEYPILTLDVGEEPGQKESGRQPEIGADTWLVDHLPSLHCDKILAFGPLAWVP